MISFTLFMSNLFSFMYLLNKSGLFISVVYNLSSYLYSSILPWLPLSNISGTFLLLNVFTDKPFTYKNVNVEPEGYRYL